MSNVEPYFGVFWGARAQTFGEYIDQTRSFLQGLQEIHPLLHTLYSLGDQANREKPLGSHLEHFEEIAFERDWDKKAPKDWFIDLGENGRPTRNTKMDLGWSAGIVNGPEAQRTKDHVYLSIKAGQFWKRSSNGVTLRVYDSASPLMEPAFADRLFRYMIEFWQAEEGLVTTESFRNATDGDDAWEQLGWMNYRTDPAFARDLPATVTREPFREGVLFRIGDGRVLGAEDTAEVQAGLAIKAAIRQHG